MGAQKFYDFILKLNNENNIYRQDTIRIFNFLYNDVYSYFDEISKIEDNDSQIFKKAKEDIGSLIDGDNSILDYYIKMFDDKKTPFINVFFRHVLDKLNFFDSKLYRENDFRPFTYIFNIYIMLKLYDVYKDDLFTFSNLLDNFDFFISFGDISEKIDAYK